MLRDFPPHYSIESKQGGGFSFPPRKWYTERIIYRNHMANPPQQLQIKASDEALQGKYSNALQITHTKEEVILDFFGLTPPGGQLVSRVITSPSHAKRILAALTDNLKKYEAQFGPLAAADEPKGDFGFHVEPS